MTSGLCVRGLHKSYGDVVALRGVDVDVPRGRLVGFLGPNGGGKTTTMRGVMGLVAMDAGSVTWEGRPAFALRRRLSSPLRTAAPEAQVVRTALGTADRAWYDGIGGPP